MKKITYRGTRLVPLSVHRLFWDQTIDKCPVPQGADATKFRESLGFLFLHLAERTGLTSRSDKGQIPMAWSWFNQRGNPARYAMHYHKSVAVQEWLEKTLIVTKHSKILGLSREWQFKPSFLRAFRKAFIIDEPLYDITVRRRRKAKAPSIAGIVEKSIVAEIKKPKFRRPDAKHMRRGNKELEQLIKQAWENQRPYRFYLDRMMDCLRNLSAKGKKSSYQRLWVVLEQICNLKMKVVGGVPGDRIVEFYDSYRINEVGSRMFGNSQALLRVVKHLCFDHDYASNYDMPQAQVTILKELFIKYEVPFPEKIQLSHTELAKILGITRETAKQLNFGGIFKGWNNVPIIIVFDHDKQSLIPYRTPLFESLWRDSKVRAKLKKIEGVDNNETKQLHRKFVMDIWRNWKSLHKEISKSIETLLTTIASKTRCPDGVYHFKNDMGCVQRVGVSKFKRERYSVLSHFLQGTESRQLLSVIATNLWCSAEFDGASILGEYNNVIPMDVKPFYDDTDSVLLFKKVWENGHTFSSDRRCITSKKVSRDQQETVNSAYIKYYTEKH
ncbi:putative helicase [Erwinia phage pEa_SNUABM_5]|uniref:Putative helicase n=1 Tax=Erwinia phage pEa_SNUABM_5 TaxID=2797313 RepID=A0A7T8EPM6_9CAUD|nr:putative helicase [Erwinia phage pEa_SNUABM_5]QQO90367.1 putative helicase [Erwinia phage pEa_SNUABM_5]